MAKYQDYVIKDGKFIGKFEEMYQDFDDPWEQTKLEEQASDKLLALNLIKKLRKRKVIELGCGFGNFTKKIKELGVDISKTAIKKAKLNCPECNFIVGDILDFSIYEKFKPNIIIMAEITWYILDSLDEFLKYLKYKMPNI